jgi:hypothetical protein
MLKSSTLEMEAAFHSETLVSTKPHGVTTQKTVTYIVTTVRTSNPFIYPEDKGSQFF